MHFIYLGHATWAAHTIPIWGPFEETGCAHTPWAYTEWAGKNSSTRAALGLCLPVTQIPAACVPLWLIGLTHSLWLYKQGFSQHCPPASTLQLWYIHIMPLAATFAAAAAAAAIGLDGIRLWRTNLDTMGWDTGPQRPGESLGLQASPSPYTKGDYSV